MKKMHVILLFLFIFTLNAATQVAANAPSFEVEHSLEGQDVELYFTVKNFTLSKDRGWVGLSLDGGTPVKVYESQKRLSGLKSGKHRIKALLQGKNGTLTGSPIEFEVNIP